MNALSSHNYSKEDYSIAYMLAIIAGAGYNYSYKKHDFGVDVSVDDVELRSDGTLRDTGHRIEFQLKASEQWEIKDNKIIYQISKKNYRDLCERSQEGGKPLVLGLLCLPKNNNYIEYNCTSLRIKNAMYWYVPPLNSPITDTSKQIKIPVFQLLTPEALRSLMMKYKNKGGICDAVFNG